MLVITEMISRRGKAFLLVIILGISIFVITFGFRVSFALNLEWDVSEGNSFTYQITSYERDANLNGSLLTATITQLPTLPIIISANTFVTDVIEISKVNCTFQNGSLLPGSCQFFYNNILSHCILPIGDWSLIEWLYPDPESRSYGSLGTQSTYISKRYDDYFHLGYIGIDFDSSRGWNAEISLDSGIPTNIKYWRYGIPYSDNITITAHLEYRVQVELSLVN